MALGKHRRQEIINFLCNNTTYSFEEITNKPDNQLEAFYNKVKRCLTSYPLDILEYYQKNPLVFPQYRMEDLQSMKYNELKEIMEDLGLKSSKKSSKKRTGAVIAQETSTYTQMVLDFSPKSETPNSIEKDLEFITQAELTLMYPEEEYTQQELKQKGIHLEDIIEPEQTRYNMIENILNSKLKIYDKEIDEYFLLELTKAELQTLYNLTLTKKNILKELPTLLIERILKANIIVYDQKITSVNLSQLTEEMLNTLNTIIQKLAPIPSDPKRLIKE